MSAQKLNDKHSYWCKVHGIKQRITALQELYDRLELSGIHLVLSQVHHFPIYRHYQVDCFEEVLQVTLEAPLRNIGTKLSSSFWQKQQNEDDVTQLDVLQRMIASQKWLNERSNLLKLCFHVLANRAQQKEHAHKFQKKGSSILFEITGEHADLEQLELSILKLYSQHYLIKDDTRINSASHSTRLPKLCNLPSTGILEQEFQIWSGFSKTLHSDQSVKGQAYQSCSYWLKLHTAHTTFINDFTEVVSKHPHLALAQYRPLLDDIFWQRVNLEEHYIIRPYPSAVALLSKLGKQHYSTGLLTVDLYQSKMQSSFEFGELRESPLSWNDLKERYQDIAFKLDQRLIYTQESQKLQFKKTLVLPPAPMHRLKIDLKWERIQPAPKGKTQKAQALLIKTTNLSQHLTHIIARQFGPQHLAKIKFSFLPNPSRYTVAWIFEDPLLSEQIQNFFESIDLADQEITWMSHYANHSQALNTFGLKVSPLANSALQSNASINIWRPTGWVLHPQVPDKDLLTYLQSMIQQSSELVTLHDPSIFNNASTTFQNLWLLNHQETDSQQKGHILCLYSKNINKSLDETYELEYSSHVAMPLSPLLFLEPIQFEIDHESGLNHNRLTSNVEDHDLETELELDHTNSTRSALDPKIIQEDEQGKLEQEQSQSERAQHEAQASERSTEGLRAELRALTHAHLSKDLSETKDKDSLSPQQKALIWLKNLNENVPGLLSTQPHVEDWLSFAQHLWWLEEYERAIDALVWMYISYMLKPQNEHICELLAGWQSRLFQKIPHETNLLKYARISLYTCFLNQREKQSICEEHDESVQALRLEYFKATRPKLHLIWLVNHCLIGDQLFVLQSYEWMNRILALGLSTEHSDPIIQQQLSYDPVTELDLDLKKAPKLQLDQNDPNLRIMPKRLRAWGYIFIEKLRTELFKFQSDYGQQINQKEFIVYRQLAIATQGLKNILYGQAYRQSSKKHTEKESSSTQRERESLFLDDEVSKCLLTRYELGYALLHSNQPKQANRPKQAPQVSQSLSILRNDPQLEFWRQYSSLNQRTIEATPLGASFKNSMSPPNLESQSEVFLIETSILGLGLTQALRRLRPQVRSYHSFKKVISFSIDQALLKHDLAWLEQALEALERWVKELDQIATVPYDVLTQLDFEYLRLRYALSHSYNMHDLCTAWVSRWFVQPKQDLNWRKVIAFQQEFSTRVLDKLSAYVSPKILIETLQIVREHLLKIFQELKEKEANYPLADMYLEQAQYQLLLAARLVEFKSEITRSKSGLDARGSKKEKLNLNELQQFTHSLTEFVNAFCAWIEESEQAAQQPTYLLKKRFQTPLSSWLYHIQYFTVPQLNQLSEAMLEALQTKTARFQARAWYIFEDAFLSKPLFQAADHPRLKIWLRAQERALRQVGQKSIE